VLPTYNRAALLQRSIGSVLVQTWRNFELLVVDDASSDDTAEVVGRIADPRVRYIRRARNGGAGAARNTWIAEARGEFIAFQDSDDEWLQFKLEKQVAALAANPAAGLAVCNYFFSTPWAAVPAQRVSYVGFDGTRDWEGYCEHALLDMFPFGTVCWVARKAALVQAGGFNETMKCWEDWELALRLSGSSAIVPVPEPLFIHHRDRKGINSQLLSYQAAFDTIVHEHAARWARAPHLIANRMYHIGREDCMNLSVERGRPYLAKALARNPWHWRARIVHALSLLGDASYRRLVGFSRHVRLNLVKGRLA
jgi:glycosyltransferase involved in cell wall biosynthesis